MMAPRVTMGQDRAPLSTETSPEETAIKQLREKVEAESDYVGSTFAQEARRMHDGESDARSIWGEATGGEARALVEDGIPVIPLPFGPRKTH